MNILDMIYKEQLEARRGRISFASSNWVFDPTPAQTARSRRIHESKDGNERVIYCIKQRGAWCQNPEIGGSFPKSTAREMWFVPAYICRKCQYHHKGKRRGVPRYPTCQWAASKNAEQDALKDTLGILHEAKKQAVEMIG